MSGTHVIETLEFDIGFRTEADAWARHASLGDFAAGRAVGIIGEVFDEFVGDERVVRFDRLEIDLGPARADESEADAEDRLRVGLRHALERLITARDEGVEPAAKAVAIPSALADLDRLWTLLHLGRLPWSSVHNGKDDLHALVERVLARDGDALARALHEAADMPRLMARIARQWSPEQLNRLIRLLAQAQGSSLAAADLNPVEVTADRAQAWERALISATAGPAADPETLMRLAAHRSFSAAIAEGRVSPTAWRQMLRTDPDFVLSALAGERLDAPARARLARTLTAGQWRELLALSMAAPDSEILLTLTADPWPWRLDEGRPLEAISQVLNEALLAHAAAGHVRVPLAGAVAALIQARADLDDRPLAEVASALAADWPTEGPASAIRERLAPILADLIAAGRRQPIEPALASKPLGPTPQDGAAAEPAVMRVARRAAPPDAVAARHGHGPEDRMARLDRGELNDESWESLLDREPDRLAHRLRELGRTAAWRSTFASRLSPIRLLQLVSLWLPGDQARLLIALTSRGEAWAPGGLPPHADLGAAPRRWLLDEVLLAASPAAPPAIVEGMIRRQARADARTPADVARALAEAWPIVAPGAETAGRIQAILAHLGYAAADPRPPTVAAALRPPLSASEPGGSPQDLLVQLDAGALDNAAWDRLLDADPVRLVRRLADLGATADGRRRIAAHLSPERLVQLLRLWLPADDARVLAALASPAWAPGAADLEGAALVRQWIFEAISTASSGPPALPALVQAVVQRRARHEGRAYAEAARALLAAAPAEGPWAATGERLRVIFGSGASGAEALDLPGGGPRDAPGAESLDASGAGTLEASIRAMAPHDAASAAAAREATEAKAPPLGDGGADPHRDPKTPPDAEAVIAALAAGPLSAAWLSALPQDLPPRLRDELALALTPVEAGLARLAGLAEAERRDLLQRLRPRDAVPAFQTLDRMALAWRQAGTAGSISAPAPPWPEDLAWTVLLRALFEEDRLFEARGFISRGLGLVSEGAPGEFVDVWRTRLAAVSPAAPPQAAADGAPGPALPPAAARAPPEAVADRPAEPIWPGPAVPASVPGESLYVANAGLVLAGPYVPMLFDRLGLTREGAFIDEARLERAVHLLQFLVDGAEPAPEHELVLNKLVCGMDLAAPIGRDFEITPVERETLEGLLAAVIQRWSIIGSTSVAGLRESFLQRRGVLRDEGDVWRLVVEPRAFDMLLDQIPWGFRTLKLAWMSQVLHVDWR